jgi:F-type H+-transporting ATPase subunit gamma
MNRATSTSSAQVRKGYEHYKRRGYQVVGKQEDFDVLTDLSFERVNQVVDHVFEAYEEGTYDKVYLAYNEFRNVMAQNRMVENFLPVQVEDTEEEGPSADYIFEPDRVEILSDLIPRSLRTQFFRAVLESNAAEQGARMVAMDAATDNAEELLKSLKLSYNKARQASITKEILEIAAGADALEQ